MYKKVFYSLVKNCKDSYKHLIMTRVLGSDEIFIKRLISTKKKTKKVKKKRKKRNKERSLFHLLVRLTFL